MKKIFNNLKNDLGKLQLTKAEKERIGFVLLDRVQAEKRPSPYFQFTIPNVLQPAMQVVTLVLIFTLTVGTGLAQASQDALPGEMLYGVKLASEEVVAKVAKTPETKIDWEIERTNRRLGEAVKLAANENLDDSAVLTISENIQKHTKKVAEEVEKIAEEKPEVVLSAQSDLETSFKAHTEKLVEIKEGVKTKTEEKEKKLEQDKEISTTEEMEIVSTPEITTAKLDPIQEKVTKEEKDEAEEEKAEEIEKLIVLEESIDKILAITDENVEKIVEGKEDMIEEVLVIKETENKEGKQLAHVTELKAKIAKVERKIAKRAEHVINETLSEETDEGLPVDTTDLSLIEEVVEDVMEITTEPEEELEDSSEGTKDLPEISEATAEIEIVEEEILTETQDDEIETAPTPEPTQEPEPLETEIYIESLKLEADLKIESKNYGEAIILLEEIYQILSKQVLDEEIEEKIEDIMLNEIVKTEAQEDESEIPELEVELNTPSSHQVAEVLNMVGDPNDEPEEAEIEDLQDIQPEEIVSEA